MDYTPTPEGVWLGADEAPDSESFRIKQELGASRERNKAEALEVYTREWEAFCRRWGQAFVSERSPEYQRLKECFENRIRAAHRDDPLHACKILLAVWC